MGSVCHGYMCILLYLKLMLCIGVVVLHRSMVDWRRGWGQSAMRCMCILLYVKHTWCSDVA